MEIWINVHTYNTYGGQSSLSLVGSFLEFGLPSFGDAVTELDVHVYFASHAEPLPTLESLHDRYAQFITTLPSAKFYRTKGKLELNYLSRLGDSQLVTGFGPPRLELFTNGAREFGEEIKAISRKLKKTDAFDVSGFLSEIQKRLAQLPANQPEFEALQQRLGRARSERLAQMDPWEKLGVDWEDFHPRAREILDDVFYWDCADDFAPHGNDTGADLLAEYQEWRPRHRTNSASIFFSTLMRKWEVQWPAVPGDDFSFNTYVEAAIGLAFAQLKIDGGSEETVRQQAMEAIELERRQNRKCHPNWEMLGERLKTLAMLESKLKSAPVLPPR